MSTTDNIYIELVDGQVDVVIEHADGTVDLAYSEPSERLDAVAHALTIKSELIKSITGV